MATNSSRNVLNYYTSFDKSTEEGVICALNEAMTWLLPHGHNRRAGSGVGAYGDMVHVLNGRHSLWAMDGVADSVNDPDGVGRPDIFGGRDSDAVCVVDAVDDAKSVAYASTHTDAIGVALRLWF